MESLSYNSLADSNHNVSEIIRRTKNSVVVGSQFNCKKKKYIYIALLKSALDEKEIISHVLLLLNIEVSKGMFLELFSNQSKESGRTDIC